MTENTDLAFTEKEEAIVSEYTEYMDTYGYRTNTPGSRRAIQYWLSKLDHEIQQAVEAERKRFLSVYNLIHCKNCVKKAQKQIEAIEKVLEEAHE